MINPDWRKNLNAVLREHEASEQEALWEKNKELVEAVHGIMEALGFGAGPYIFEHSEDHIRYYIDKYTLIFSMGNGSPELRVISSVYSNIIPRLVDPISMLELAKVLKEIDNLVDGANRIHDRISDYSVNIRDNWI